MFEQQIIKYSTIPNISNLIQQEGEQLKFDENLEVFEHKHFKSIKINPKNQNQEKIDSAIKEIRENIVTKNIMFDNFKQNSATRSEKIQQSLMIFQGRKLSELAQWKIDSEISIEYKESMFEIILNILQIMKKNKISLNITLEQLYIIEYQNLIAMASKQSKQSNKFTSQIQNIHQLKLNLFNIKGIQIKSDNDLTFDNRQIFKQNIQNYKQIILKLFSNKQKKCQLALQSNREDQAIDKFNQLVNLKFKDIYEVKKDQENISVKNIQRKQLTFSEHIQMIQKLSVKKQVANSRIKQPENYHNDIVKDIVKDIVQTTKKSKIDSFNLKHIQNIISRQKLSKIQNQTQSKQQNIVSLHFLQSASQISFKSNNLHKIIQEKQIFYLIKTTDTTIGFYSPVKLSKNFNPIFGEYFPDIDKQSFIYDFNKNLKYHLKDPLHSVGYGPQLFFTIGKLDYIISCFNIQSVTYFPFSYTQNIQNKLEQGEEMLQKQSGRIQDNGNKTQNINREIVIEEIDIYEVRRIGHKKQ